MKLLCATFAIKSLQLPLQRVSLLQEMEKKGANFYSNLAFLLFHESFADRPEFL